MAEHLLLKWGTLKGWNLESEKSRELMRRYADLGMSLGAMQQHDTPEQKQIICDLIDALEGDDIQNDWDGKRYSKAEAKRYIMEYPV
jgi:hypothetical protein